nr:G2/mitotic-specific cyclin-2 [Tanacetum cinerariifolium]
MEDIFKEPIMDINISDTKNPLAVVEYVQDLYTHYRWTECNAFMQIFISTTLEVKYREHAEAKDTADSIIIFAVGFY